MYTCCKHQHLIEQHATIKHKHIIMYLMPNVYFRVTGLSLKNEDS